MVCIEMNTVHRQTFETSAPPEGANWVEFCGSMKHLRKFWYHILARLIETLSSVLST